MKVVNSINKILWLWVTLSMLGICSLADAQTWQYCGSRGISDSIVGETKLLIGSNGTPYVAYLDNPSSNRGSCVVKKFNGTAWVNVGSAFGASQAFAISMAMDSSNNIYVAYSNPLLNVVKFDGSNWVNVGVSNISTYTSSYNSIAIAPNGTPYIAFGDSIDPVSRNLVSVKKFDGSNWVYVGGAGISYDMAFYTSLAIDSNNVPYVGYANGFGIGSPGMGKANVKKFDGSNWVSVGIPAFSNTDVYHCSFILDRHGVPYFSYTNPKGNVEKFDGTNWVYVGDSMFSASNAWNTSLAFDASNNPYIAYGDFSSTYTMNVKKFDGTNWGYLGNQGFSQDSALHSSMAISNSGQVFVSYADKGVGYKASVMKFTPPPVLITDTVWPGDANNDEVANNVDVLTLGLAYQDTGSVRPSANNTWTPQACQAWVTSSLGVNHDHTDCNGNGIVDANDTVPILLNYGLTHLKTDNVSNTPGAPQLYLDIPLPDSVGVNTPVAIPVKLGLAPDTANNTYGIAFTINYDTALVKSGSAYFQSVDSWLGTLATDLIYIQYPNLPGRVDVGITRTNHTARSGGGTIGTFGFITIDNLSGKTHLVDSLHLTISNIIMIDQNGVVLNVNAQSSKMTVYDDVDGIANVNTSFELSLYPNPATNYINYNITGLTDKATYSITDITGRELIAGEIAGKGLNTGTLNLSNLSKGIYVFKLSSANGVVAKRIVLQ